MRNFDWMWWSISGNRATCKTHSRTRLGVACMTAYPIDTILVSAIFSGNIILAKFWKETKIKPVASPTYVVS